MFVGNPGPQSHLSLSGSESALLTGSRGDSYAVSGLRNTCLIQSPHIKDAATERFKFLNNKIGRLIKTNQKLQTKQNKKSQSIVESKGVLFSSLLRTAF